MTPNRRAKMARTRIENARKKLDEIIELYEDVDNSVITAVDDVVGQLAELGREVTNSLQIATEDSK